MKAYGMSLLISNTMGTRTEVLTEDDIDYLRVLSPLEPDRVRRLQKLVEVCGWEFEHKVNGTSPFLAVVPSEAGEEVS